MLARRIPTRWFAAAGASKAAAGGKADSKDDPNRELSFLESVLVNFDKAAPHSGIPKERLDVLRSVDASLKLTIPLKRDDGSMAYYTAFRA
jgi:hypothetical protein